MYTSGKLNVDVTTGCLFTESAPASGCLVSYVANLDRVVLGKRVLYAECPVDGLSDP